MSRATALSLDITSQLKAEWQRSGINFRVMLVGESGLGKSTFTRALLRPYVPEEQLVEGEQLAQEARDPIRGRTDEITETIHQIENDGYPVEFTIVDCPGYGDALDSSTWINSMIDYLFTKFGAHYEASCAPASDGEAPALSPHSDGLVHVCLYFIAAHRLKGVDVEFMKRLERCVNLIPVIAKADTMTVNERDAFRREILSQLRKSRVRIFELEGGGSQRSVWARGLEARCRRRMRSVLLRLAFGSTRGVGWILRTPCTPTSLSSVVRSSRARCSQPSAAPSRFTKQPTPAAGAKPSG